MDGFNTTIPAAIDALVALWSAAFADQDDVSVNDGPVIGGDGTYKRVSVGWDGNEGAAQAETSPEGLGGSPDRETYTIFCSATASVGDSGAQLARNAVFGLFSTCTAALGADRTLGGLVLRAMPASVAYHQVASPSGRQAILAFGISVTAFTS